MVGLLRNIENCDIKIAYQFSLFCLHYYSTSIEVGLNTRVLANLFNFLLVIEISRGLVIIRAAQFKQYWCNFLVVAADYQDVNPNLNS